MTPNAVVLTVLALVGVVVRLAVGPLIQAASPLDAAMIDDGQYLNAEAAQAAWKPMRGTEAVSTAVVGGRKAVRLPCNFAGTRMERASWDRQVALDLSAGRGVELRLFCRDASPVAYFSLYFQSGEGWYHATFFPESAAEWNTIRIDKSETSIEGKPAGWSHITALRLSAWRSRDADTEFFLTGLRQIGVLGADAAVAIVRAESAADRSPGEAANASRYAEAMAQQLQALDLGCAVVSDRDVTSERLRPARLVILPHNPSLRDEAADALARYVEAGGKLIVFYSVPDRLRSLLKVEGGRHVPAPRAGFFSAIRVTDQALPGAPEVVGQQSWNIAAYQPAAGGRVLAEWLDDKGQPSGYPAVLAGPHGVVMTHVLLPDDADNKRRLLLAMAGLLVPDLWRQTAEASIARIGVIGGAATFDEAVARTTQEAKDDPRVLAAIGAARELRESAIRSASERQFAQSLTQAGAASQKMTEGFCLAQSALPGEFRAFWCHSAFGVEGLTWDEAIRRLATNGFTAILPNMLWGGVAFYESRVLPVAPQVARRGDQIAECLAACRKYGVQLHVWKVNWNLSQAAPGAFVDRLRREHRLQASVSGKEEPWLCPSHPENQQLEIASMTEVARKYEVDGLHFDYIRYPDGDHCFCGGCRERFQRACGEPVRQWPREVLADGRLRQPWLDWRRANITAVVKAVSEQARALKPGIAISAAVFRNWPADRDSVGQDWKLWCDRGWLDFVCPMDYTPSNRSFQAMVEQQVGWAGRARCYPGIGVSASTSRFGVDRVIEQIGLTRRSRTQGFVIFNYGVTECKDLLPLLGLGITGRR